MDNKDKLISRQVALKGAIELACHSDMYFESLDEVLATAEIIQNFILSPFYKVAEKMLSIHLWQRRNQAQQIVKHHKALWVKATMFVLVLRSQRCMTTG